MKENNQHHLRKLWGKLSEMLQVQSQRGMNISGDVMMLLMVLVMTMMMIKTKEYRMEQLSVLAHTFSLFFLPQSQLLDIQGFYTMQFSTCSSSLCPSSLSKGNSMLKSNKDHYYPLSLLCPNHCSGSKSFIKCI